MENQDIRLKIQFFERNNTTLTVGNRDHAGPSSNSSARLKNAKRIKLLRSEKWRKIIRPICIFIFLSVCIFSFLHWRKSIPLIVSLPIGLILGSIITIGSMISLKFRCTMVLCLPELSSQEGRLILLSVITGLLAGGPLISITRNTNEIAATIFCIPELAKIHAESLASEYRQAYNEMKEAFEGIFKFFRRLAQNMSGDTMQFMLSIIKIYFEIVGFFLKTFFPNYDFTNLLIELTSIDEITIDVGNAMNNAWDSTKNLTEITKEIQEEFNNKFNIIQIILNSIQYILIATILIIPYKSYRYLSQRLKDKKSNNAKQGPRTPNLVIPKNKIANEIAQPKRKVFFWKSSKNPKTKKSSKQLRRQKKEIKLQMILLFTHLLLSLTIFAFDYTLYWITSTVEQYGNATYVASGEMTAHFKLIGGDQFVKPFLEIMFKGYNMKRNYTFVTETGKCLPNPVNPGGLGWFLVTIIIYGLATIIIVSGTKLLWIKNKIYLYFYP